ncbi:MAG: hypothetical protein ACM3Y9_11215 [Ignavibacteria bacterium]
MSQGAKLLRGALWLSYPLIIYFGIKLFEPRTVALALGATLLLRHRQGAGRLLAGLSRVETATLAGLLGLAALAAIVNSEALLRFYPVAVSVGMLSLFGLSLKFPPSMVERFARLRDPELPPDGVRYTRRVTQVWCAFFVANGAAAAWTAVYASRDVWALYNGLIAYVLMGALFAGEWLVRRFAVAPRVA